MSAFWHEGVPGGLDTLLAISLLMNYYCAFLCRYMALGIALRYVLDALRKPLGNKMYCFGIAALDRFKTR